jgi:hypothetical protein
MHFVRRGCKSGVSGWSAVAISLPQSGMALSEVQIIAALRLSFQWRRLICLSLSAFQLLCQLRRPGICLIHGPCALGRTMCILAARTWFK